ncbi:hypothetical protein HPB51_026975 [Rhipicephalus microplus]|uniref:Uncharacterized protein n=1 Tax=Rhipicephalus microplus TaxID=6941 RepID=A0A9J6D1F1_RHIMP|nr:hypothetical protein HPB51_026975 [Rhipicephalus microplus]
MAKVADTTPGFHGPSEAPAPPILVHGVQHHEGFVFQVSVNSRRAVGVLLGTGGLGLGTKRVSLVPLARQVTSVTCLYLPCYEPDSEVAIKLESYGTMLGIEQVRYKDCPSIQAGTRYLKMDMRLGNPLPNFARVRGHKATFKYRGVKHLCCVATKKATSRPNATPHIAPGAGSTGTAQTPAPNCADAVAELRPASTVPRRNCRMWQQ